MIKKVRRWSVGQFFLKVPFNNLNSLFSALVSGHWFWRTQLVACLSLAGFGVSAGEITAATAEQVGMSRDRLNRVSGLARSLVDSGEVPGVVTLVARHGKIVHFHATGTRGVDDPRAIGKSDIFRLFSMSKPVTAVAAMQLYEQGKFKLGDPVTKYIPEFAALRVLEDGELVPVTKTMTMHHLLTHTSGLATGGDPQDPVDKMFHDRKLWDSQNLHEFVKKLSGIPLREQPGTRWRYSIGMDVMGLIIERITGQSYDDYLREHLFAPLRMDDTGFTLPQAKMERLLPNHYMEPADGTLRTAQTPGDPGNGQVTLFLGGSGLVSTAEDYLRFAEMLRNNGELDAVRILGAKTLEYMTKDHLPGLLDAIDEESITWKDYRSFGFGLGFAVTTNPVAAGILGSPGEYYWNGFAGTLFWVDPVEDIVAIGMIQRLGAAHLLFEDMRIAVNQAIEELN